MGKVEYFPYRTDGRVLTEFFWDRSPVSIIQGPVGSGTSTACCHKMWKIALEQKPDGNGIRKSRWLIVRNTFDQLKQSTLKTWRYWFEEIAQGQFGVVKMSNPPEHRIEYRLPDKTIVRAEFIFLSLDSEEDVGKLLSMEYTGVWFNEGQFSEKVVFDMAQSRAMQGRYPPKLDGGPTWKGVLIDLNAPPEGHWIPYMRGDVPLPLDWDDDQRKEYANVDGWSFFMQPPGLIEIFENGRLVGYKENPEAENTKWLQESYLELIKGKSKSYIDTYVMNRVGLYRSGEPVFESFVPETHISKEPLKYLPEWPLIVGLDFARNPAAVICQMIRGQMYVLDEFGMENVSAGTFAPLLKQRLIKNFPAAFTLDGQGIQFWGDPTGGSKGQATDNTPFSIFKSHGMPVVPAPGGNSISVRLEAVESLLNKMIGGGPALILDPHVRTLKAGMSGAYHFAKIKGQARYHDQPYKDRYSDFCDALQYACLGVGVGFSALNPGNNRPKPVKARRKRFSLKRA